MSLTEEALVVGTAQWCDGATLRTLSNKTKIVLRQDSQQIIHYGCMKAELGISVDNFLSKLIC